MATDADWVAEEVSSALLGAGIQVSRIRSGRELAVALGEVSPDLVVLDMQIGSKGGFACCMDLRQDIEAGRVPEVAILMLLDREADEFLAQQSGADGWVVKPLNPLVLKRTADGLLAGGVAGSAAGAVAGTGNSATGR